MSLAQPQVVQYLRENLKNFPIDQLRAQLAEEGISDIDFDEALKVALRSPEQAPLPAPAKKKSKAGALMLLAGGGLVALIGGIVAMDSREDSSGETAPPPSASPARSTEGAFVGHTGYVVRLPKDYMAIQSFRDPGKKIEVVHFCKVGTDPTQFLHDALFGQLGIVRLEVQPSPLAGNLNGVDVLSRHVTSQLDARGDKYTVKPLQLTAMRGFQVIVEPPNPAVDGYVLGERSLYRFSAGHDDDLYRELLNSLRDMAAEN
jgi:hypothetical protein